MPTQRKKVITSPLINISFHFQKNKLHCKYSQAIDSLVYFRNKNYSLFKGKDSFSVALENAKLDDECCPQLPLRNMDNEIRQINTRRRRAKKR